MASTRNYPLINACLPDEPTWPSLLDQLLWEQQNLTAVERFARLHEADQPHPDRCYSARLPASPPQEGEQYAFEVDLDLCTGCKACVTACHTLNGLDENETWRDVGLLHGGTTELPVIQHVSAACHHCLEPACLNVCPVKAYEKDPATGIVKHWDDQCIGCQYCMLACPYDVPKYNRQKGIVRKCDMCSSRLAVGEAPACVQACPNQAIRITVVRPQEVIENCETGVFLPSAPDPSVTLPTTHYKTGRVFPRNTLPADYYSVKPQHAHLPLVFTLVLTQLSVGAFLVALLLSSFASAEVLAGIDWAHSISALVFGLLALGASVFHLGRPLYAFRVIMGLKTSWLSREILAFGIFAVLAAAYATIVWRAPHGTTGSGTTEIALGAAVVIAGLCGIVCSIMIYQCTQRSFWNGSTTSLKFLLTMMLLGIVTVLLTSVVATAWSKSLEMWQVMSEYGIVLLELLMVLASAKLLFELSLFLHLRDKQNTPSKRSALLMRGDLSGATKARFGFGLVGGVLLPGLLLLGRSLSQETGRSGLVIGVLVVLLFAACVIGELLERYLFFAAVVAPRMPGRLRP